MNQKLVAFTLTFVFVVSTWLVVQDQQMFANDIGDGMSSEELISLVVQFEENGEFVNSTVARALKTHLTAVDHYEQQEATEKVVKHIESFLLLIDHQLTNVLISKEAYAVIKDYADKLLGEWAPLVIVQDGQATAAIIVSEADRKLEKVPGWNRWLGRSSEQFTIATSRVNSGQRSLHINDLDNKDYGADSELVEIVSGENYTASVRYYLEQEDADPASLLLCFYDADKKRIQQSSATGFITGEWSDLELTRMAPANAVYASVLLYTNINGTRSVYFDDASLRNSNNNLNMLHNPGFEEEVIYSHSAADSLAEYVGKSTGVQLPILTEEEILQQGDHFAEHARIYIGKEFLKEKTGFYEKLETIDNEGFMIQPKGQNLYISGPTKRGTENGIYEFLERFVGVRWLFPGPEGEDVPQHDYIEVARTDIIEEPIIKSRSMSPIHYDWAGEEQYEWGLRNRLNPRIAGFKHNIYNIFPPSKYKDSHPEFYPLRNGVRYFPPNDTTAASWQPCFSEPGTVQVAVDWVLDYFSNNPEQESVSLAVNDGSGYCEQEPGHSGYTDDINSIGIANMSDIYYPWVNQVVEEVLEVYPDKWFGVLAYQHVNDPPSEKLHPRVMPYITKDRLSWVDDEAKAKGHDLVEQWKTKSENIAFYDYTYGTPYVLPRIYNHHFADYLRYGKDQGMIAYVTELYPNWGEGPKPWLMSKLLWNPEQDVDALLNEWYVRAVGPDAASDLKAYFDYFEHLWTERLIGSDWLESRKNTTYLAYFSPIYLNHVTDNEIAECRRLLESVVEKAITSEQRQRAHLLLRAFEYYEASALSFPKKGAAPSDAIQALEILEDAIKFEEKLNYAIKRVQLIDVFADNAFLKHPWDPRREPTLVWSGWNPDSFWNVAEYIKEYEPNGGPVLDQVSHLLDNGDNQQVKDYAKLLLAAVNSQMLNTNSSFEEGADAASDWEVTIMNFGEFERFEAQEHAYTGDASIYVHNFYYGSMHQTIPVKPGFITSKFNYFVTPDTNSVGTIFITLDFLDEHGQKLTSIKSESRPFSISKDVWDQVRIIDYVPQEIDGRAVAQVKMAVTVNGFFEGGTLYLDDFEIYQ